MPRNDTLDHLARLYATTDDPWNHRGSAYEATKYDATLEAVGVAPYREALEIGCGNGTLARLLATRCQHLTAIECIPAAARAARRDLADLPQVRILEGAAPDDLPHLHYDLVVLSEVLYFLTPGEIDDLGRWLHGHATGLIVAVNWTGPTTAEVDGRRAVALLAAALGTPETWQMPGFRIDLFRVSPHVA